MQEINLYHLLKFYYKRTYLLVFYALLGFALALIYNVFIQTPSYRSSTSALVTNNNTGSNTTTTILMNNLVELTESRAVLEKVIEDLNLDTNYTQISGAVTAQNPKDTAIIKIDVVSTKPEMARDVAKATYGSFEDKVSALYDGISLQKIDDANLEGKPFNVRQGLQLILGTMAGLLFGIIALFFVYDFKLSSGAFDKKSPAPKTPNPAPNYKSQELYRQTSSTIARNTSTAPRTPTPTSVSQGNAKILNLRQKPSVDQSKIISSQNKDRLGIGK